MKQCDRKKLVSIDDNVIQIVDILRYAKKNDIKIKEIDPRSVEEFDCLPHFCRYIQEINGDLFYSSFSFRRLVNEIEKINDIDLDNAFPIIVLEDERIIDGAHRLAYALINKIGKIKAIKLTYKDIEEIVKEYGK